MIGLQVYRVVRDIQIGFSEWAVWLLEVLQMLGRSGVAKQGRADESSMVMVTVASVALWLEVEALVGVTRKA